MTMTEVVEINTEKALNSGSCDLPDQDDVHHHAVLSPRALPLSSRTTGAPQGGGRKARHLLARRRRPQHERRDPSRLARQGDGASADVPRIERLLDDLLCVPPGERSVMLEDLCEAYPEDAASLRQRYEALDRMGMLEHEAPAPPAQLAALERIHVRHFLLPRHSNADS